MMTLLFMALRNVVRNRRRTLITLLALIVGVGVMVSVRGLLNGLQTMLVTSITQGQTGALQVHKKGYMQNVLSTPLTLDFPVDEVLKVVEAEPHVTAAAPRIGFAGMVSNGDDTLFMAALGLDEKRELLVCPMRLQVLTEGSDFVSGDKIVITRELARAIGFSKNVEAALLAPDKDGALSGENVHLGGTMELAFPGERKVGFVPLALAQRLLKMEGRATEIAVAVNPIESTKLVQQALQKKLGPNYEVHAWDEIATFVREALSRQESVISLIASGFLLLMLLGVANTMLMSVMERTREIGTMMALGVKRQRIVVLFLSEALFLGLLGGALGSSVGFAVVAWLGQRGIEITVPGSSVVFTLVPEVTLVYLAQIVAIAVSGAVLFAIYPAVRASRLRPVQALAGA